jgi:hypothetical protein
MVTQMMLCALVFFREYSGVDSTDDAVHEHLALCLMGFFAYQHITEKRIKAAEAVEAAEAREAALMAAAAAVQKTSASGLADSSRGSSPSSHPISSSTKARDVEKAATAVEAGKSETLKTASQTKLAGEEVLEKPKSQLRLLMLSADPDAQAARELRRQEKELQVLKNASSRSLKIPATEPSEIEPAKTDVEARIQARLARVPPEKRAKHEKMLREQVLTSDKKQDPPAEAADPAISDAEIIAKIPQMGAKPEHKQPAELENGESKLPGPSAVPSIAVAGPEKQDPQAANDEIEEKVQRKLEGVTPEKRAKYEKLYRERYTAERQAKQQPAKPTHSVEPVEIEDVEEAPQPPAIRDSSEPVKPAGGSNALRDVNTEREVERQLRKVPEEKRAKYAIILRQKLMKERETGADASEAESQDRGGDKGPASAEVNQSSSPARDPSTRPAESGTEKRSSTKDAEIEEKVQRQLQDVPAHKRDKYEKIFWQKALKEREAGREGGDAPLKSPDTTGAPMGASEASDGVSTAGAASARRDPPPVEAHSKSGEDDIEMLVHQQLLKIPVQQRAEHEGILWQKALADRTEVARKAEAGGGDSSSLAPPLASGVQPESHEEKGGSAEVDSAVERYVQKKLGKVPPEKREKYEKIYRERALAERAKKVVTARRSDDAAEKPAQVPPHSEVEDAVVDTPTDATGHAATAPSSDPSGTEVATREAETNGRAKEHPHKSTPVVKPEIVQDASPAEAEPQEAEVSPSRLPSPTSRESESPRAKDEYHDTATDQPAILPVRTATHESVKAEANTATESPADMEDVELEKQIQRKLLKITPEKRAKYYDIYRKKLMQRPIAAAGDSTSDLRLKAERSSPVASGSSASEGFELGREAPVRPEQHQGAKQMSIAAAPQPDSQRHSDTATPPPDERPTGAEEPDAEVEAYVRGKLAKIPKGKWAKYEPIYRTRAVARKASQSADRSRGRVDSPADGLLPVTTKELEPRTSSGLEVSLPESTSSSRSTTPTDEPDVEALRGKSYTRASISSTDTGSTLTSERSGDGIEANKEPGVEDGTESYIQAKLARIAPEKRAKYERALRARVVTSGSTTESAVRNDRQPVVDPSVDVGGPRTPVGEDDGPLRPLLRPEEHEPIRDAAVDSRSTPHASTLSVSGPAAREMDREERRRLERKKAKRREERRAALAAAAEEPGRTAEPEQMTSPELRASANIKSADRTEQSNQDLLAVRPSRPRATPLQPVSTYEEDAVDPSDKTASDAVPDSSTLPPSEPSRRSLRPSNTQLQARKPSVNSALDVQRVREALRRISETDTEIVAPFRTRRSSSVGEHGIISFSFAEPGERIKRSTTPDGEPMSAPLVWSRPSPFGDSLAGEASAGGVEEGPRTVPGSAKLDKGKGKMTSDMLLQVERGEVRNRGSRSTTSLNTLSEPSKSGTRSTTKSRTDSNSDRKR